MYYYTITHESDGEHVTVRRSQSLKALQGHPGKITLATDRLIAAAKQIGFVLEGDVDWEPRVEVCSFDGASYAEVSHQLDQKAAPAITLIERARIRYQELEAEAARKEQERLAEQERVRQEEVEQVRQMVARLLDVDPATIADVGPPFFEVEVEGFRFHRSTRQHDAVALVCPDGGAEAIHSFDGFARRVGAPKEPPLVDAADDEPFTRAEEERLGAIADYYDEEAKRGA